MSSFSFDAGQISPPSEYIVQGHLWRDRSSEPVWPSCWRHCLKLPLYHLQHVTFASPLDVFTREKQNCPGAMLVAPLPVRTWFFTGSQSPKSQMQVEGPCFPSSAAQRSWNSAQQQNSDASGWQLQQGMYCWPQQWKDRPRSYGTKLLSTTHPPQGLPQPKVAMAKSMLIP